MKTQLAALSRIALGWVFLWAFLDKLIGFGFTTRPAAAWLAGGSPTYGFLTQATKGPLAPLFQSIAGAAWVDMLFMLGLLGVGIGLIFGVAMKLSTRAGAIMVMLMYLAALPPAHNPFIDEHIIYALILLLLPTIGAHQTWSISAWWRATTLVKKIPWIA